MNQIIVSSLVAVSICSSLFAYTPRQQSAPAALPFYQGDALCDNRYPPAYAAPAKIDLLNRPCSWPYNIFIDASFIYWYTAQDGMELAESEDLETSNATVFNRGSTELMQPFSYTPGFKIGLGIGVQEWEYHAEYTWLRQHTSISSSAPKNETLGGTNTPVWLIDNWFAQGVGAFNDFVSATHISSSWRLGIDWLDATAGRPYYQSKNATISPYGGIRAIWIRQSLLIAATVPAAAILAADTLAHQPIHSHNHSNSWGLGPVFGASGHCLVGGGFRVEGDGGISILFTQYTTLFHKEDAAEAGTVPSVFSISNPNYNCVRPMANLGLGLGWGKYLGCGSYHLDFSADYEFNMLWDQNMMRTVADDFTFGVATSNDLFLHGLTLTARFDF